MASGSTAETEITGRRENGQTFAVRLKASPLFDQDGKATGFIEVVEDVTERRQVQQTLEEERHTLKHLLRSSDHERQLIAYEIHDGLAQQLAGAIMQLEAYFHQKNTKPAEAEKALESLMTTLRQGHCEARRLISGVRPPVLDESGIVAAVAHLVNEQRCQDGIQIDFQGEVGFERLVPILENAVYRIVQEGLANACKHSRSKRVRVELLQHGDDLASGYETGEWASILRKSKKSTLAWPEFGSEQDCWEARLPWRAAPEYGTCITVELPLVLKE